MCSYLKISRSSYYKIIKTKDSLIFVDKIFDEFGITSLQLEDKILSIYKSSRNNYGSRKISKTLEAMNIPISSYKVLKITKRLGLRSGYSTSTSKPYNSFKQPKDSNPNILNQNFTSLEPNLIVTSDLTYIKVNSKFYYICFLVDLFNREITSHEISSKHDTQLVIDCIKSSSTNFSDLMIFHSDRGGEFRGTNLVKLLESKNIEKSMSKPGCPFDNAVSESLFGIFKREWAKQKYFSEMDLRRDVTDFVHWYNYFRIHSTLNYSSPVQYRLNHTKTIVH